MGGLEPPGNGSSCWGAVESCVKEIQAPKVLTDFFTDVAYVFGHWLRQKTLACRPQGQGKIHGLQAERCAQGLRLR